MTGLHNRHVVEYLKRKPAIDPATVRRLARPMPRTAPPLSLAELVRHLGDIAQDKSLPF